MADPKRWTVLVNNQLQSLCCPGCQSVATAILAGGFGNFYQYRREFSPRVEAETAQETAYDAYDVPGVQQLFVHRLPDRNCEASLLLPDIHCAACCWLIESALRKEAGIQQASVNLGTRRARITWNPEQVKLSHLLARVHELGYKVSPYQAGGAQELLQRERKTSLLRMGIAGLGMMQSMMFALALYSGDFSGIEEVHRQLLRWFGLLITLPVAIYSAWPFYRGAWRNLKASSIGMDVPISLAIISAMMASLYAVIFNTSAIYFDSVSMFIFLLLVARYVESSARYRLENQHAASVLPVSCLRLQQNAGAEQMESVPVTAVAVGDMLLVRPGETVPLDGVIVEGSSAINESALTGESHPVYKHNNDVVYAGTLNGDGLLRIVVSHLPGTTRVDMINYLGESGLATKPKVSILADRLASAFTVFVLLLAVASGLYWMHDGFPVAFPVILSVLVVSCPCALSLATPAALAFHYHAMRRSGLLVSNSSLIEQMDTITDVVFDKTGTLTTGQLAITRIDVMADNEQSQHLLELASALEKYSEHPIATAFHTTATDLQASSVSVVPQAGVEGVINGICYRIGSRDFCRQLLASALPSPVPGKVTGQTIYLVTAQGWLAGFELTDPLRTDARDVVQELKRLGKRVTILSGDSSGAAEQLASVLGVDECLSGQSPEQKLGYIRSLQQSGRKVLVAGDGINDVPVLASADVSIAMNNASDLAKVKADTILLVDRLSPLLELFRHSHKTRRTIVENLWWALLYNGISLPLAAMGYVAPWQAAVGMSASSLLVTVNSMRLQKA